MIVNRTQNGHSCGWLRFSLLSRKDLNLHGFYGKSLCETRKRGIVVCNVVANVLNVNMVVAGDECDKIASSPFVRVPAAQLTSSDPS